MIHTETNGDDLSLEIRGRLGDVIAEASAAAAQVVRHMTQCMELPGVIG